MEKNNRRLPLYSIAKTHLSSSLVMFPSQKRRETKYPILPPSLIFIFASIAIINAAASQPSAPNCSLDFKTSTFGDISGCGWGKWGCFLSTNCCRIALNEYLYVLAQRANQTGQIYLKATEQRNCLDSMKNFNGNISSCGFQRLVDGHGGCSNFSVGDVANKLGNDLKSLSDDCKFLNYEDKGDLSCGSCLRKWDEMGRLLSSSETVGKFDADVCRFAVLVSLMSSRIDDENWVRVVYRCLGEQDCNQGEYVGKLESPEYVGKLESPIKNSSSLRPGLWILIGVVVGITMLVIFVTCILLRKRSKSNDPQGKDASEELLSEGISCQKISIKEIYAATNNLNALNFIGQGIAGKVYKGVLSNGRHVAIKHIIKEGYAETFVREVTSLSHVRHPNLVKLLGHCEEEEECFLVYELCLNGNLSEWLFGKDKILSWMQRLEIALNSAQGLWFLHSYPEGCIVHRDIKPTNILLGDDFEAKLSDFGLSKVMDLGQSYVSSEVRGTFGYVDPEYQRNHHVNPATDVYSFGIVLLQILSGKRVINLNVRKPMSLEKMAKVLTRGGNISEFVDPKISGEYSMEAFDLVLKLALSCTAHKQQRPTMEQVVIGLEKALDISTDESSHFTPPPQAQSP